MKALKIIGGIVVVLIIAFAGLLYYTYSNLDSLIQTTVERAGSAATDTSVELSAVDVNLQEGRVQLSGFTIANPPDYSSDYAFALDDIVVRIDPGSIGTGADAVITIEEVLVDGASVIAELKSLQENNLKQLADNIQSKLPADDGQAAAEEPQTEYTGPNFRVAQFRFSNANITLTSEQFGERRLDMPTVNASDIGGQAGVPPQQLAAALMDEVLDQARATVQDEVEDAAREEVRSRVQEKVEENLSEEEQDTLNNLRDFLNR